MVGFHTPKSDSRSAGQKTDSRDIDIFMASLPLRYLCFPRFFWSKPSLHLSSKLFLRDPRCSTCVQEGAVVFTWFSQSSFWEAPENVMATISACTTSLAWDQVGKRLGRGWKQLGMCQNWFPKPRNKQVLFVFLLLFCLCVFLLCLFFGGVHGPLEST